MDDLSAAERAHRPLEPWRVSEWRRLQLEGEKQRGRFGLPPMHPTDQECRRAYAEGGQEVRSGD